MRRTPAALAALTSLRVFCTACGCVFAPRSKRTHPLEVMDVRLEIEPALARLAAMRATNGDIERLLALWVVLSPSSPHGSRSRWR